MSPAAPFAFPPPQLIGFRTKISYVLQQFNVRLITLPSINRVDDLTAVAHAVIGIPFHFARGSSSSAMKADPSLVSFLSCDTQYHDLRDTLHIPLTPLSVDDTACLTRAVNSLSLRVTTESFSIKPLHVDADATASKTGASGDVLNQDDNKDASIEPRLLLIHHAWADDDLRASGQSRQGGQVALGSNTW